MNLHQLVSSAISAVNPPITGTISQSTGYTTAADGTQIPSYATVSGVAMQVQALQAKELAQLESLNIQGLMRAVYLNGNTEGVVRPQMKGGDLLTFNQGAAGFSGTTWKVIQVLETWDADGWCKVAVQLQVGGP